MTNEELAQTIRPGQDGSVICCHVQPNAAKTAVIGMYDTSLKIALKAPPVDGKANKELCRFWAELCDVSRSSVQLISGQTSRDKRIFVPVMPAVIIGKLNS